MASLTFLAREQQSTTVDLVALMQAVGTVLMLPDQRPPLIDVCVQEDLSLKHRMIGSLANQARLLTIGVGGT